MGIVAGQTGRRFDVGVGLDLGHVFFVMAFEAQGITGPGQEKAVRRLVRLMAAEALPFLDGPVHELCRIDLLQVGLVAAGTEFVPGRAQLLGESRDMALAAFPVKVGLVDKLPRLRGQGRRRERVRSRDHRRRESDDGRGAIYPFKKECEPLVFRRCRAAG